MKTKTMIFIVAGTTLAVTGLFLLNLNNDGVKADLNKTKRIVDKSNIEYNSSQKEEKNSTNNIINNSSKKKIKDENNNYDNIYDYVKSLPEPTQEDKERLEKDVRYEVSFSRTSEEIFKEILPNISQEKLDKIIEEGYGYVFKSDYVGNEYILGNIDYATFLKAQKELSNISDDDISKILSKEEFEKYNPLPREEREFDFEQEDVLFEELSMIHFTDVGKKAKSMEDVYKIIDPSTLENVMKLKAEMIKEEFSLYKSKKDEDSYMIESDNLTEKYESEMRDLLTEEQQKFLGL